MELQKKLLLSKELNQRLVEFYLDKEQTRLNLSKLGLDNKTLKLILLSLNGFELLSLQFPESTSSDQSAERKINFTDRVIVEIDLSNNELSSSIKEVAEYANKNKYLKILNLSNNHPDNFHLFDFINILKSNKTLQQLYLDYGTDAKKYNDLYIWHSLLDLVATSPSLIKLSLKENYFLFLNTKRQAEFEKILLPRFSVIKNAANHVPEIFLSKEHLLYDGLFHYEIGVAEHQRLLALYSSMLGEDKFSFPFVFEEILSYQSRLDLTGQSLPAELTVNLVEKIMIEDTLTLEVKYRLILFHLLSLYPSIPVFIEPIMAQAVFFLTKSNLMPISYAELEKKLEVDFVFSLKQLRLMINEMSSFLGFIESGNLNKFYRERKLLNKIRLMNIDDLNFGDEICKFLQKIIPKIRNEIQYQISNYKTIIYKLGSSSDIFSIFALKQKMLSSFELFVKNSSLRYIDLHVNQRSLFLESILLTPDKPLVIVGLSEQEKLAEIDCSQIMNNLNGIQASGNTLSIIRKNLIRELSDEFYVEWKFGSENQNLPDLINRYAESDQDTKKEMELFFNIDRGISKLFKWFEDNLSEPIKISKLVNDERAEKFFKVMFDCWRDSLDPRVYTLYVWTIQNIRLLNLEVLDNVIRLSVRNTRVAKSLEVTSNVLKGVFSKSDISSSPLYINLSGVLLIRQLHKQNSSYTSIDISCEFYQKYYATSNSQKNYLIKFNGANLRNADFRLVEGGMSSTQFNHCWLQNVEFGKKLQRCLFTETTIKQVDWSGSTLKKSEFSLVSFEQVNLEQANIKKITFRDSTLDDVKLSKINATRVHFYNTRLNPENGKIEGAIFFHSIIDRCSWDELAFPGCDFSWSIMKNSSLKNTQFGCSWQLEFIETDLTKTGLCSFEKSSFLLCKGLTLGQMPKNDQVFLEIKIASLDKLIPEILSCHTVSKLLSIYENEKNGLIAMRRGWFKSSTWNIALIVFQYMLIELQKFNHPAYHMDENRVLTQLAKEDISKPKEEYLDKLKFNKNCFSWVEEFKTQRDLIEQLYASLLENKYVLVDLSLPRPGR